MRQRPPEMEALADAMEAAADKLEKGQRPGAPFTPTGSGPYPKRALPPDIPEIPHFRVIVA